MPIPQEVGGADWHRRVVDRSLRAATQRSIDRGAVLVRAAGALLERSNGEGFTVQDVADEAGQSLRTLYQYFASKDDLLLAVFEEAMALYAATLRDAIAGLDDPVERLAGTLVAAVRLPERARPGTNLGLGRLHRKLAEAEPALVRRSQAHLTSLLAELLEAAAEAGAIDDVDRDETMVLLLWLTTAVTSSATLGNDTGVRLPDALGVAAFSLRGLGARLDRAQLEAIESRLRLPKGKLRLTR